MSQIDDLIATYCPEGVEFMTIGEMAECLSGATPTSGVAEYWENGTIPWMSSGEVNNRIIFDTAKKITQAGFDSCSTKMVSPGAVIMALAGLERLLPGLAYPFARTNLFVQLSATKQ